MTKPTFTDEFKQGVVQYVLDHPNESKVAVDYFTRYAPPIHSLSTTL